MSEMPETNGEQGHPTDADLPKLNVRRQRELFEQAIAFATPHDQREFLRTQCDNDPQMQQAVESLLRFYSDDSTHWLNNDLFETAFVEKESEFGPGTRIDRYELKELLGSGGMGAVWLAYQSEPVARHVAIKFIRSGRESSGFLKRFDTERRALAAMNHPNIAAIFDAGQTEQGQPYFAMEFVQGVAVNEFCTAQDLSLQERLELFVPICRAVEHAHQNGIIHRDLKPSNVLISHVDGGAVPKIIDFGLARALSDEPSEENGLTQAGVLLGTPDYMAPEQASFGGNNVDIRSDVFALGVILFELLTASRLHSNHEYAEADFDGKLQMIRNFESPRPSAQLAAAGDPHDIIYANLDRRRGINSLRGELDWIVVKSLENEKNRRYQSAGELCADIQRYLNSETVLAHPPSRTYILNKFLRRHRGLVVAVASVALAMMIGLVGTIYGLISANNAARVAVEQRNKAALAEQAATRSAQLEKEQREFSDAIVDFLKNDFLLLTTVDGQFYYDSENMGLSKDSTLQDLLNRAGNKLRERDDLAPKVRAELAWTIGTSYRVQGNHQQAIELLRESLEIRREFLNEMPDEYLNCANSLSVALSYDGDRQAAIEVLETAIGEVADLDQIDPEIRNAAYRSLATNFRELRQIDRARKILEEVYNDSVKRFGEQHRGTIFTMLSLAKCDRDEHKMEHAARRYQQVIDLARRTLGAHHPATFSAISGYVKAAMDQPGQHVEAVQILKDAIAAAEEHLGIHHPRTNSMMISLGHSYWANGDFEQAIETYAKLAERNAAHFGDGHLFTIRAKSNLALNYRDSGNLDDAIETLESLLETDHLQHDIMTDLADTYREAGRKDAFLKLLQEPLQVAREKLALQPRNLAQMLWHLSADSMAVREYETARELAAESLQVQLEYAPEHYERYIIEFTYASTLFFLGKLEAVKEPIESAYAGLLKNRGKHPIVERRLREVVGSLIVLARKLDNSEDLAKWQSVKARLVAPEN